MGEGYSIRVVGGPLDGTESWVDGSRRTMPPLWVDLVLPFDLVVSLGVLADGLEPRPFPCAAEHHLVTDASGYPSRADDGRLLYRWVGDR